MRPDSRQLFPNIHGAPRLLLNADGANRRFDGRELTRQIAHFFAMPMFNTPVRNRVQRRRAESLAGAQTETGMMPLTSNRIAIEKPLFERRAVVRADSSDCEHLITAAGQKHRLTLRMSE